VPYLLLGLQDVQWTVGNSRGARKLARTPHVKKKKTTTTFTTLLKKLFIKKKTNPNSIIFHVKFTMLLLFFFVFSYPFSLFNIYPNLYLEIPISLNL
jgi:hypothetical protein